MTSSAKPSASWVLPSERSNPRPYRTQEGWESLQELQRHQAWPVLRTLLEDLELVFLRPVDPRLSNFQLVSSHNDGGVTALRSIIQVLTTPPRVKRPVPDGGDDNDFDELGDF